jgi:anaerobic magnesium-protoporphyrin IX monomethyl ester cyclase
MPEKQPKKMKVLLVNLPYLTEVFGERESTGDVNPPLGILYIASHLKRHNIDVDVLDANALGMTENEIIDYIGSATPTIIGFTCTTIIMPAVARMAEKVKRGDNFVIVGGPHVSAVPTETLEESEDIDIVVIGEGEITMLELAQAVEGGKSLTTVKGIAYRDAGEIRLTPSRGLIHDLNDLEFPARDLVPIEKYKPGPILDIGFSGKKFGTIVTARGCTGNCTFCSSKSFWKRIRIRNADNILDEIDYLVEQGVKHLMIVDDTFTCQRTRLIEFCEQLIKRKYNIQWSCYARVSDVDPHTLRLMKDAGCFFIYYGVESGSQEILDSTTKMITLEQVKNAVEWTKRVGIIANCSFIMGLPGETKETLKMTLDFAIELNPHIAEFYIATPFPGTQMYEYCKSQGWLKEYKWSEFTLHKKASLQTCAMLPEIIEDHIKNAYRKFYIRPRFMLLSLKKLASFPRSFRIYKNSIGIFANSVLRNKLP